MFKIKFVPKPNFNFFFTFSELFWRRTIRKLSKKGNFVHRQNNSEKVKKKLKFIFGTNFIFQKKNNLFLGQHFFSRFFFREKKFLPKKK